jgi:hypothetical protein
VISPPSASVTFVTPPRVVFIARDLSEDCSLRAAVRVVEPQRRPKPMPKSDGIA